MLRYTPIEQKDFDEIEAKKERLQLKTMGGWADEWIDSIKPENNKIDLLFPRWNTEFKGKLRSKLCVILGYSKTKKSLLGQNIVYNNTIEYKCRSIYSTMEMGIPDVVSRFINMKSEAVNKEINASLELENIGKKNIKEAERIYKEHIAPSFGDLLLLTPNASMTAEKYDKLLTICSEKGKPIDIICVDGLSMMGGPSNETERYSVNSMELKELAKKWKIFVMLICHVSKGPDRTTRDLSNYLRSSEKIADNCDFYISMSQIEEEKEKIDVVYSDKYGVARLVNKRGSGRIIDNVYEFVAPRLRMIQTDKKIQDFKNKIDF